MEPFRLLLMELSKHIDTSTLDSLKYLCQDVVVPAKMERVKTALDLFRALEECGKISKTNASYLATMLESEGKYHLAEKLAPYMGGESEANKYNDSLLPLNHPQKFQQTMDFFGVPEPQLNMYRQILRKISKSLNPEQVRQLCYLSQEAEYEGVRHRANLDGTMLFNFFEQQVLIAPTNLEYLQTLLYQIGRMDLCSFVNQYTRMYLDGQPAPLNKPAASSGAMYSQQMQPSGMKLYSYNLYCLLL